MLTDLYWIDGCWSGRLALAARPRGGDWLSDEMAAWRAAGVDAVVSLLTPDEERDLDLEHEKAEALAQGMEFVSFPIPDRQTPPSMNAAEKLISRIGADLNRGNNVVIHCRQGIGRTGLIAASLLVWNGWQPDAAVSRVSAARGAAIPETAEQRAWIDHYASDLVAK